MRCGSREQLKLAESSWSSSFLCTLRTVVALNSGINDDGGNDDDDGEDNGNTSIYGELSVHQHCSKHFTCISS